MTADARARKFYVHQYVVAHSRVYKTRCRKQSGSFGHKRTAVVHTFGREVNGTGTGSSTLELSNGVIKQRARWTGCFEG